MVSNALLCSLINIRLASKHVTEIHHCINNFSSDIVTLTETWLKPDSNLEKSIPPPGYSIISIPRKGDGHDDSISRLRWRIGGLAVISRNNINANLKKEFDFKSMECTDFNIKAGSSSYTLCAI